VKTVSKALGLVLGMLEEVSRVHASPANDLMLSESFPGEVLAG
jgi:hypothetical protein